ncbi:Meiotic recombination protein rec14 [Trichophyton interdigitale]|uniref:Meiotic recombination protein rec n=1 Tax=Trichophyton interdigitale TaxID=101480 RepID=A0A9P4YDP4_9EURO|nr:Meiotic recombination protein rec [Trichophyton interdigitale]KAF3896006.1 Meiotic recombination protein rec [Trichophyton interdigitale]KAG8207612.1 Meiotic recombination protein rec14 [Trichophyton interdigitale]
MAALRLAGPSAGLLSSTALTRTLGIYTTTAGSSITGSLAARYHASRYAVAAVLPSLLSDIWESILRAVPKKKTSHMKKRHRQMAGKALKDNISLNTCPACGNTKRAHLLCPHCVAPHISEIFSLAVTPTQILSASGASSLKVHLANEEGFGIAQSLSAAHKIGCHHLVTAKGSGCYAASVGFGGEVKLWRYEDGMWNEDLQDNSKIKDIWAVSLSSDARYLAGTTHDGRIKVWDLQNNLEEVWNFETRGSFGMCVDMSPDGRLIASGHQSGSVYVFDIAEGRMPFSLSGSLAAPVRAVSFSPGGKLLAATGDSTMIMIYETSSGEQFATLIGHAAWVTSLDWNDSGEYLLSGSFDGKVKVWSIERKACVATLSESDKAIWSVKWLPKVGKAERFAAAGASQSIALYREANSS